jgi:hypothetical protein
MTTVFIGGSRDFSRLNDVICERLQAVLDADLGVFLGDANGADKAAQRWFADRGYRQVTVFHSGSSPRNNLGNWETRTIVPKSKKKDFLYHTAKDLAMAEQADYGFMLWDGISKGSLNNILNLLERDKKVVVYFNPAGKCINLRRAADVIPLLDQCPKTSMEEFESKINLSARIAQPQATLNLV